MEVIGPRGPRTERRCGMKRKEAGKEGLTRGGAKWTRDGDHGEN